MSKGNLTIDDVKKNLGDWLEKGKQLFNIKTKFTEAKLKDGTIVSYDGETPMVNMPVFVLDEKGNQIPLMDGAHETEDGTILTVAGGVITDVKGGEAQADPNAVASKVEAPKPTQDMAQGITEAQAKTVIESIVKESRFANEDFVTAKIKEAVDSLAKENELLKTANTELKGEFTKQSELNKELFEIVKKLGDAPADEKVTLKKVEKDTTSFEDKIKAFHKATFK